MKILIVDDSEFMRLTIKKMLLDDLNNQLYEANNEDDAILKYKELNPDVVFLDIMMKKGDGGIIALKKIKEINKNAKIIIITALNKDNILVNNALNNGAIAVIKKPFSKEELLKYI
jgi:two-component system, chemotaxis family, chemotaxis protein CheY